MPPDSQLLRRYSDHQDQTAFRDWVELRLNLVYSVALRILNGDTQFAEDVAQQVFTDAARQAPRLANHPAISAWLFTSTRFAAAKAVRVQRRRRQREHSAAMDLPPSDPEVDWTTVRPVIDDVLASLPDADRDAILLRYFDQADYATIGARLDLTANAARMRVERALDKLSAQLRRRGITSTTTALATTLTANSLTAAPAGLAATISSSALSAGALSVTTAPFIAMFKAPLIATAVVVATGVALISQETKQLETLRQPLAAPPSSEAVAIPTPSLAPTSTPSATTAVFDADYAALENEVIALRSRLLELDRIAVSRLSQPPLRGKIYDIKELDAQPKPNKQVPPKYPEEMRRLGVAGRAVISMTIDKTGAVRNLQTISTTEDVFAEAALEAVSQWQFNPGQLAGLPVNTKLQVPIILNLSNEPAPIDDWF
jgi:RNA polymerase sigma factor (sigma-70 family)